MQINSWRLLLKNSQSASTEYLIISRKCREASNKSCDLSKFKFCRFQYCTAENFI